MPWWDDFWWFTNFLLNFASRGVTDSICFRSQEMDEFAIFRVVWSRSHAGSSWRCSGACEPSTASSTSSSFTILERENYVILPCVKGCKATGTQRRTPFNLGAGAPVSPQQRRNGGFNAKATGAKWRPRWPRWNWQLPGPLGFGMIWELHSWQVHWDSNTFLQSCI